MHTTVGTLLTETFALKYFLKELYALNELFPFFKKRNLNRFFFFREICKNFDEINSYHLFNPLIATTKQSIRCEIWLL